jgi:hypothetical protein
MTRLFAVEELAVGRTSPQVDARDKQAIPTGPSRLVESSEERRARQRAEAWKDLLEAIRQSSANRLELLLHRRGDDLVPCPWGRLVPCDAACRCAGAGSVTTNFLREHYAHLVAAVERAVQGPGPAHVEAYVEVMLRHDACSGGPEATEVSPLRLEVPPRVGRRRPPRRQSHWTGESRLRYANARYEQLLVRLCDRETLALSQADLAAGHGPCAACRRLFPLGQLEVGHVDGALWDSRSCSAWVRAARLWQEHEAGVRLRVLCQGCWVESPERGRS